MTLPHEIYHVRGEIICRRCGLKGEPVWTNSIPCTNKSKEDVKRLSVLKSNMYRIKSRHSDDIKDVSEEEYFSLDKRLWKDYKEPFNGILASIVVDGKRRDIRNSNDLKGIYIGV